MKIGIDLDDTVAETNARLVEEALIYDRECVSGKGFKDKDAETFMDMFFWNVLDIDGFFTIVRSGKFYSTLDSVERAVENVNKLYKEGHKIIFITRRTKDFKTKMRTKKWLKEKGFKYHRLILGCAKKGSLCHELGIDLFIDNDVKNIKEATNFKINSILKGTKFNRNEERYNRIEDWDKIYEYVKEVR